MSLATGAVLRERFEIRGLLGRGGMGNVFRAFDRELGVEVALKSVRVASPQAFYRLKAEFRALAGLRHRNLRRALEIWSAESDANVMNISQMAVFIMGSLRYLGGSRSCGASSNARVAKRSGVVTATSGPSAPSRFKCRSCSRAASRRHGAISRVWTCRPRSCARRPTSGTCAARKRKSRSTSARTSRS